MGEMTSFMTHWAKRHRKSGKWRILRAIYEQVHKRTHGCLWSLVHKGAERERYIRSRKAG